MRSTFHAHPLVRGGQLQTLVGYLYPGTKPLQTDETLILNLDDGDALALDINHPAPASKPAPLVYLVHGLGGCSRSAYNMRIARKLVAQGCRTVRHNHRGCGAHAGLAKGIYHSGSTADILAGLRRVAALWPASPIFVVGFSLSGTILLNLLGLYQAELAALPQVRAAMAVCAPLDLHASSAALAQLGNRHYDVYYTRTLLRQLQQRGIIDAAFARKELPRRNLRQFDRVVTAPLGGFDSLHHYYDSCSPRQVMARIQLPTLVLLAADDPIVPLNSVSSLTHSPQVEISLQSSGGHLGFLSRTVTGFGDHRWLDAFVVDWIREQSGS